MNPLFAFDRTSSMNERLRDKIENLMLEYYNQGVAEGRSKANAEIGDRIIAMLSAPQKNGHDRKPRTRTRQAVAAPPAPEPAPMPPVPPPHANVSEAWPEHETPAPPPVTRNLVTLITSALHNMPLAGEGVDPDGLTQFIKLHSNGDAENLSVREVRATLRQMTMTGEVRRVQRGRYIAGTQPPGPAGLFGVPMSG
jgi:hypothetical protein